MGLRKFFKKVGKVAKKALPFAAAALPFIPGVGSMASTALGAVGSLWGGSSAKSNARDPNSWESNSYSGGAPPDVANQSVNVTGQREQPSTNWGNIAAQAIPAIAGWYGQKATNSAQIAAAREQMDFQAEQTGSSYQRGVADMKAAGLNPMLAYSQGGAASGGGAQATIGNELGAGMASAQQVAMTRAQLEQINAQTGLTDATADKTRQDEKLSKGQTILTATQNTQGTTQTKLLENQARQVALQNFITDETKGAQISLAHSSAKVREYDIAKAKWNSMIEQEKHPEAKAYGEFFRNPVGKHYPWVDKGGATLNSAASAAGKLFKPDINIYKGRQ